MRLKHWVIFLHFFIFIFLTVNNSKAQTLKISDSLVWSSPFTIQVSKDNSFKCLKFKNGIYPYANSVIPLYSKKTKIPSDGYNANIRIINVVTQPLSSEELSIVELSKEFPKIDSLLVSYNVYSEKKSGYLILNFCPIIKNRQTNSYEKVKYFNLEISLNPKQKVSKGRTYVSNSILANGKFYKYGVKNTGIYKIGYSDIIALGIDPSITDPANAAIFGNGGTPIPEDNSISRPDDIRESAIFVSGGGDGKFDANDYILFYAKSPNGWSYNSATHLYEYQNNAFTDYAYYFLTFDSGVGLKKRIPNAPEITEPYSQTITSYSRYFAHEKDVVNLVKSGKNWLGEVFDVNTSYSFPFRISNLDLTAPLKIGIKVAHNAKLNANFSVNIGGSNQTLTLGANTGDYSKATEAYNLFLFSPTNGSFNVNLSYTKPSTLAIGWLNNIVINAKCNLLQSEPQMVFSNPETVGLNSIVKYDISNASSSTVWDVTDINNISKVHTALVGNTLSFVYKADTLCEFVSFNGQSYNAPQFVGTVDNQNLHALPTADMLIITHTDLISEAQRLQLFHQNTRGLIVHVVTTNQIYNEFGSGSPDISAIRDFIKMFYDKYGPNSLKYVLLFGDASYDYKNILNYGNNYVPTYENDTTPDESYSFSSDDYFGLLDDNEGNDCTGLLDIGIGRFVVNNTTQARQMVDKTIRSCSKTDLTKNSTSEISNFGDWKNSITIIGDDEDGNTHLSTAIRLTNIVEQNYPNYNLEKIFLDAYPQVSNSGGQRYPDVEIAINEKMRKGTLLMNYVGHGGEVGWAHERILRISDIQSWSNKYNMPVMLTATCEFTRYDDPSRVSAGELVFLNSSGGASALLTTSRIAWSGTNEILCINFFNNVFQKIDGKYSTLGDLVRISKNLDPGGWSNLRNFVLIGDPSVSLAFPTYSVQATHINGNTISATPDTLKALSFSVIKGIIKDNNGNKMNTFNGEISVTIYDKPSTLQTLGNDPSSPIVSFNYQKNILFRGKSKVINGDFEISFIVPKDIAYNYGFGKISFYAKCDTADACGYFNNIVVGGISANPITDNLPPNINLFLNDEKFVNMGLTNENPVFIAQVSDSSGINVVGNTIGHDAVITIDGQTENCIEINDYFETEMNSFQKGKFRYPLKNIAEGKHNLTFKVWDILNNSAEKTIEFTVVKQVQLKLDHVLNYPNPFTTQTNFYFEHNQAEAVMDVRIQIFTITGKLIKTITQNTQMNGFRSEGILWDGTDEFGDKLAKGVYLYKLSVRNNSSTAEKIEKLVIL
jgi:hypothetical protein